MVSKNTSRTCVDFTLLGYFQIEPKPSGAQILVTNIDEDEYVGLVTIIYADSSSICDSLALAALSPAPPRGLNDPAQKSNVLVL